MTSPDRTYINGMTYQNNSEEPLRGTDGDDIISGVMEGVTGAPVIQRVFGGLGNDRFDGTGHFYGGEGNDYFQAESYVEWETGEAYGSSLVYGGPGRDYMVDFYGSTKYFGGKGADYFTNHDLTEHVSLWENPDVDAVELGLGGDTAEIRTSWYSGSGGYFWAPRFLSVSGGSGLDTLRLVSGDGPVGQDIRRLDLRSVSEGGQITVGGDWITLSGFERFQVVYSGRRLEEVILGAEDDSFVGGGNLRRNQEITYRAGARDDFIIGDTGSAGNVMFGGAGGDVLVLYYGTTVSQDKIFGGAGDDFIYVEGRSVNHRTVLRGGNGEDTFLISDHNRGKSVWVKDFDEGEDRLIIDAFGSGNFDFHMYDFPDIVEFEGKLENALNEPLGGGMNITDSDFFVREDAGRVVIVVDNDPRPAYGFLFELSYNKRNGVLKIRDDRREDFEIIARFDGAPDLGSDDFLFL